MKTLKITLLLIAVLLLTVSGVKPDGNGASNANDIKQQTKIDLVAHGKKKEIRLPGQG